MAVMVNQQSALDKLSLTPLIDIVFLLLIFFLVATRFAMEDKEKAQEAWENERQIKVTLPEASEAQPLTVQPRELFITIDENGQYFVSGKPLTLEQLHPVLKAANLNNPGRASAVIRGDERCPYGFIITAKDACMKAGIRDIRETTRAPQGG